MNRIERDLLLGIAEEIVLQLRAKIERNRISPSPGIRASASRLSRKGSGLWKIWSRRSGRKQRRKEAHYKSRCWAFREECSAMKKTEKIAAGAETPAAESNSVGLREHPGNWITCCTA